MRKSPWPHKEGLITEPHRYIWPVYWRYKLAGIKPTDPTERAWYKEAERRLFTIGYESNKQ